MPDTQPQISIIIPVFNEAGNLRPLAAEIDAALGPVAPYEVVFVDDGSSDGTADEIAGLASANPAVRSVTHESTRGQSAGIVSGVRAARAPVIAILDGDGQNDPADIPLLFAALQEDERLGMVVGFRKERRDNWVRKVTSRLANAVRGAILKDGVRDTGCSLKVFYRSDFLELPTFDHMHRFLPALMQRDGRPIRALGVNHRPRVRGISKYGIGNRLWVGITDLFGVWWLNKRRF